MFVDKSIIPKEKTLRMNRSLVADHSKEGECLKALYDDNDSSVHHIIQQYESTVNDSEGYDQHLMVLTENLPRLHDECLVFLRCYGVIDIGDYDFLLNDSQHPTTARKLLELINILAKKPRHSYWYFAHSFKTKAYQIFYHLHGDIKCCVCKQIQKNVENQARLKDTKSETMEGSVEIIQKENNDLRKRLSDTEKVLENLQTHCTNLSLQLEAKNAEVNRTNTKLSRSQEKFKEIERENTLLKRNYDYAKNEWETMKTNYDEAVRKNFSLLEEVKHLNEELMNLEKWREEKENYENSRDICSRDVVLARRGPSVQPKNASQAPHNSRFQAASDTSREQITRVVRITKEPSQPMGFEISGGNIVGIYVTTLVSDSPAELAGVRLGDKIVKINVFDMSRSTKDAAIAVLNHVKGDESVTLEVAYTTNCKDILQQRPHDSMYLRTCREHEASVPKELSFLAGEKLHVTKTFTRYESKSGQWKWKATRLAADGKQEEGYIPVQHSLTGLPEELLLARTLGTSDAAYYEPLTPMPLRDDPTTRVAP